MRDTAKFVQEPGHDLLDVLGGEWCPVSKRTGPGSGGAGEMRRHPQSAISV